MFANFSKLLFSGDKNTHYLYPPSIHHHYLWQVDHKSAVIRVLLPLDWPRSRTLSTFASSSSLSSSPSLLLLGRLRAPVVIWREVWCGWFLHFETPNDMLLLCLDILEWYHGRLLIFCYGGGKPFGRYATAVYIWKADDDYPRNSHLDCFGENQRGCRLLLSWKLPMDLKACCVSIHTIAC